MSPDRPNSKEQDIKGNPIVRPEDAARLLAARDKLAGRSLPDSPDSIEPSELSDTPDSATHSEATRNWLKEYSRLTQLAVELRKEGRLIELPEVEAQIETHLESKEAS